MKVTPFGKHLRKLRIDKGVILRELAEALGVSTSFLSAMELGKKAISQNMLDKISTYFELDNEERGELFQLAEVSKPQEKIDLKGNSQLERELVLAFARKYREKTPEQQAKLRKILEEG